MPLNTCEMRWFREGALPDEVERWFEADRRPASPPWREDRYLVLPDVADMGIKWREGRLEIKGRTAALGTHVVAPGIEGVAERWSKWSYGSTIAVRFRSSLRSHDVIAVGKRRAQRHFLLAPGGRIEETTQRDVQRRGFSIELTRIRCADSDHWSLGLEAAPDDARLLDDLMGALSKVLPGIPLPLPRESSRSYPEWLAGLDRSA